MIETPVYYDDSFIFCVSYFLFYLIRFTYCFVSLFIRFSFCHKIVHTTHHVNILYVQFFFRMYIDVKTLGETIFWPFFFEYMSIVWKCVWVFLGEFKLIDAHFVKHKHKTKCSRVFLEILMLMEMKLCFFFF